MFSLICYKNIYNVTQKFFSKFSLISETDKSSRSYKNTASYSVWHSRATVLFILPVPISWSNSVTQVQQQTEGIH